MDRLCEMTIVQPVVDGGGLDLSGSYCTAVLGRQRPKEHMKEQSARVRRVQTSPIENAETQIALQYLGHEV